MADLPRKGLCNEPGPYSWHCTEPRLHDYSCYDAQEDTSWNDRSPEDWQLETPHDCEDAACMVQAREDRVRLVLADLRRLGVPGEAMTGIVAWLGEQRDLSITPGGLS